MDFKMKKAILLAENLKDFVAFIYTFQGKKLSSLLHMDKLVQVRLLAEEYQFQIIADELERINQFSWNGKYTHLLVEELQEGINVIAEYAERNYDDLFLFTARIDTLKKLIVLVRESG
ncbi:hypothetical protein [Bacillus sp. 1P06AnD]|uniref:hypothetical protein n=1 Tax=Bacillus sp. 1P06AnD TaxID=3132208 RepID=UPI0039A0C977